jgi:hypothetical protein
VNIQDTHEDWRRLNRGDSYDRAATVNLLRLLHSALPDGHFDEINVATRACDDPRLMAALGFLHPVRDRRRWCLTGPSNRRIERWLIAVNGFEFDGVRLDRHLIGWCDWREVAP